MLIESAVIFVQLDTVVTLPFESQKVLGWANVFWHIQAVLFEIELETVQFVTVGHVAFATEH